MPHFGGSLLPSSDGSTLVWQVGKWGAFQVKPIQELDTYGLYHTFRAAPRPEGAQGQEGEYYSHVIAMHPNGYSCKNLADRILQVWKGEREPEYAMKQFQYILACGGLGSQESAIAHIIAGKEYPEY